MKTFLLATLLAPALLAGPIAPGDFVIVPDVPDTLGVSYADFLLTPVENTPDLQSVLTAVVWDSPASNPYGGLTFSYTFDASQFQTDTLRRFDVSGFEGVSVSIEQSAPVVGKPWSFAFRDGGDGDTVHAFIHLAGTELSQRLILHTDATDWGKVSASAINGSAVSFQTLGPFEPGDVPEVPEPREWAMLAGFGLFGLAVYRRIKA